MRQHATASGDLFTIRNRSQQQEHRMALEILNYLYRSAPLAPADMSRAPFHIMPRLSARFRYGIALLVLAIAPPAMACWNEAAQRYGVNPQLLYAIAKTESGLNSRALNRNPDGSYDIGLMQINSRWIPTLRRYGISEARLFDPCTSIHVGAWILAQNMRRLGNTWNAVGAYNAKTPAQRLQYAIKVYRNIPPEALRHR
jgi:soluble lytic murein transglycosylase-like protein